MMKWLCMDYKRVSVYIYIYTYIYMVYHIQLVIKPNWSDAITQSGQLSSTFFNTSNGSSFIENFFNLLLCIIRETKWKKSHQKNSSWWFQPIWKIVDKLDHFPNFRSENKKYLSCHHLENRTSS